MANYGVSFQPGRNGDERPGYSSARPAQSVIDLLSLRLPTSVGPSAIAPQALLQASGAAGLGIDPSNLLRALMALSGAMAPPTPSAPPSPMMPVSSAIRPQPAFNTQPIPRRPQPVREEPRGGSMPLPRIIPGAQSAADQPLGERPGGGSREVVPPAVSDDVRGPAFWRLPFRRGDFNLY